MIECLKVGLHTRDDHASSIAYTRKSDIVPVTSPLPPCTDSCSSISHLTDEEHVLQLSSLAPRPGLIINVTSTILQAMYSDVTITYFTNKQTTTVRIPWNKLLLKIQSCPITTFPRQLMRQEKILRPLKHFILRFH